MPCLCFVLFLFLFFVFIPRRLGFAVGSSAVVSGALYAVNPPVGILAGVVSTVVNATNVAAIDSNQNDFEDITTGYIVRQLIDAQSLVFTEEGKLAFVRGRNQTILGDASGYDSDDSSCCIGCMPIRRKIHSGGGGCGRGDS